MAVKKPGVGQVIGSQQKFLEGAGAGGGAFRIRNLFGPMKKANKTKSSGTPKTTKAWGGNPGYIDTPRQGRTNYNPKAKVYDPYNYPASGKFPAEKNPKRMSFKDEMFKLATTPRRSGHWTGR
jgi:hypothetical protein